jgi:hypothetical protein
MSEWSIEHAWKLIPFTRADAHQIPPTHFRSTTSRNNDVLQRVHVSRGVCPGCRGVCDTVLTQSRFLFKRRHTDAHGLVHSIWQYPALDRLIARRRREHCRVASRSAIRNAPEERGFQEFRGVARAGRVCVRSTWGIVRRRSLVRVTLGCRPAHRESRRERPIVLAAPRRRA